MARSDRLLALIQILRDGNLHRAEDLARNLEVTQRTIYRDMDRLKASGVPVSGERGTGYRMSAQVTLPPLNLTMTELESLHLGMAVVVEAADDALRDAARTLSAKIDAVLPEDRAAPAEGWGTALHPFADAAGGFEHLPPIRNAIRASQKLRLSYRTGPDIASHRIRPLQLEYWGRIWTATAWCDDTGRFEVFRVDHIEAVEVLPELFVDEPGKRLADYAAQAGIRNG